MNGFTLSGLFAKVAPSTRSHCSAKARHKRAFTTRLGIEAWSVSTRPALQQAAPWTSRCAVRQVPPDFHVTRPRAPTQPIPPRSLGPQRKAG